MSRTLQLAERFGKTIFNQSEVEMESYDLAELAQTIFERDPRQVRVVMKAITRSDLIIVASPTYKATYTGLLKAFFDHFPTDGLKGVIVLPVMTGGAPLHALAPSAHLVPLLMELGAAIPVRPFYFDTGNIEDSDKEIESAAKLARMNLRRIAEVCSALPELASDRDQP